MDDRTRGGLGIPIINLAPAGRIVDYEEYGVDSGQGWEYVEQGDIEDPLAFGVRSAPATSTSEILADVDDPHPIGRPTIAPTRAWPILLLSPCAGGCEGTVRHGRDQFLREQ
jgi:hypothetical protein